MLGSRMALAFPPKRGFKLADINDPDHPGVDTHVYRIMLTNDPNGLCAIVDAEDYWWACKWRWKDHPSNSKDGRVPKHYACRTTNEGGMVVNGGSIIRIYLHKAILQRKQPIPPSPLHTIGDHEDGDSLNCRRYNLSWATPSMNAKNRKKR